MKVAFVLLHSGMHIIALLGNQFPRISILVSGRLYLTEIRSDWRALGRLIVQHRTIPNLVTQGSVRAYSWEVAGRTSHPAYKLVSPREQPNNWTNTSTTHIDRKYFRLKSAIQNDPPTKWFGDPGRTIGPTRAQMVKTAASQAGALVHLWISFTSHTC